MAVAAPRRRRDWHALRAAVYAARAAAAARRVPTAGAVPPEWPTRDADALLVERVKRGDVRAFEMLVVKYQRRIERLIGRMVRDVDLVQDIAQETFIRAYRALPQFRGDSAFYTWLYRIAVNTAKKALVDLKRDPLVSESALRVERRRRGNFPRRERTNRRRDTRSLAGQQGNRRGRERRHRSPVRGSASGDHAARDRRPELRRDCRSDELPDRTVRSRIFRAREAIAARLRPLLDTRDGERW